jgi:hypothetical protein
MGGFAGYWPGRNWRAQEVVKYALENADWDEGARIITLHTEEGHIIPVESREELKTELRSLCSDEWHSNAMKIDGEFVAICDDSTWVSEALEDYDDRLAKFFAAAEEVEDDDENGGPPWSSP